MRSTGEVAALGRTMEEALLKSWLSAEGNEYPRRGSRVLVYDPTGRSRGRLLEAARTLLEAGYEVYTLDEMPVDGLPPVSKARAVGEIREGRYSLVLTTGYAPSRDYEVRRASVDFNTPLVLDAELAYHLARAIARYEPGGLEARELRDYWEGGRCL
jgi:carbamoyl-phosphate synthase large subunit